MLKGIHLVSIMGNQGTLTKTLNEIVIDAELWYHLSYLIFCVLGLFMHPFFYSVLVSSTDNKITYTLSSKVVREVYENTVIISS